jgi:hypothetical protein
MGDRPIARSLLTHRTTQNKCTEEISMNPAFKNAKTIHALDCVATVIAAMILYSV